MILETKQKAIVASLIFAAAGLIGWQTTPPLEQNEPPVTPVPLSTRSLENRPDSGSEALRLRTLRLESERLRKAIEMARNLPTSEIGAWLNQGRFNFREGYAIILFEKIALDRWASGAPAEFLEWALQYNLDDYRLQLQSIVREYPEIIRAALDQGGQNGAQPGLLRVLVEINPDFALGEFRRILPDLKEQSLLHQSLLRTLMETRPTELTRLFEDPSFQGNPNLAAVVLSDQLNDNFDATFNLLLDRSDGYQILFPNFWHKRSYDPDRLLARLPDFPTVWHARLADDALAFTRALGGNVDFLVLDLEELGFSEAQSRQLRGELARYEVQSDPSKVFGMLHQLELSDYAKAVIFESVLAPNGRAVDLAQLTKALNPEDRVAFEEAIADRKNSLRHQAAVITNQDELLAAISREELPGLGRVLNSWTDEQKAGLLAGFDSLDPGQKSVLSKSIYAESRGVPPELKSKALLHLAHERETGEFRELNYSFVEITSKHALDLMEKDAREASAWINRLPEGELRLQSKKNLALNWRNYDPEATAQWLSSQPSADRSAIEEFLKSKR